ncbi:hypothetical protein [Alkalihalophilus marmarensis]|uniref:hypothetical protein n=1 Tax=Alkalihalophilus marmarensis TaxID=521377 RepID=UPI002DB6ABC8|nr:hypothetical protein [Alkalihalophilus marmarensis]MEC2072528.1 hypothetical protein [Alkalihalophilus marmarensis]
MSLTHVRLLVDHYKKFFILQGSIHWILARAITALVDAAVMGVFEFYFHTYIANKEVGMCSLDSHK